MSAVITSRSIPSRGTKYTFWRGALDEVDCDPPAASLLDDILRVCEGCVYVRVFAGFGTEFCEKGDARQSGMSRGRGDGTRKVGLERAPSVGEDEGKK